MWGRAGWRLVFGAGLVVVACSSSTTTVVVEPADAGSASSSSSSSSSGLASSSSSSSSSSSGGPVDGGALPTADDCETLTADQGFTNFTDISADATMEVRSIQGPSIGGRPDEGLFLSTALPNDDSVQLGINYNGPLAAGTTFQVGPDPGYFTDAGRGAGSAWAEYIELYQGVHARNWVSLGGGSITIVCVKNLDSNTGEATIIASFEGIKMGLPPPQPAIDWKGSFTASGVYRHVKQ